MKTVVANTDLGVLLQAFFLQRLIAQRNVSPQTVAAYRDTFRLLLQFARQHVGKAPERLDLTDLDAPLVLAFLDHLERERHNTIRTRNARLAAIRSFMHFAGLNDPTALPSIRRVLAIPVKRFDKPLLGFLSKDEIQAILDAPPSDCWTGQRDRTMLATLYNTGARVSELTGLHVADLVLEGSACVHLHGKGRKNRSVPLWPTTRTQLRRWLPQIDNRPDRPLFPSVAGRRLTRPAVTARLRLAVHRAAAQCPSLSNRCVSPHCVRHNTETSITVEGTETEGFIDGFSAPGRPMLRIIGTPFWSRLTPCSSSRSQTLEEFEESIRGAISSGTGVEGSGPQQRPLFQSHVRLQVDLRRLRRLVAEPERNDGTVHAAL